MESAEPVIEPRDRDHLIELVGRALEGYSPGGLQPGHFMFNVDPGAEWYGPLRIQVFVEKDFPAIRLLHQVFHHYPPGHPHYRELNGTTPEEWQEEVLRFASGLGAASESGLAPWEFDDNLYVQKRHLSGANFSQEIFRDEVRQFVDIARAWTPKFRRHFEPSVTLLERILGQAASHDQD